MPAQATAGRLKWSVGMRKLVGRGSAVVFVGIIAAAGLAGCGGATKGSLPSITLYNGQHIQTTQALVTAFEKQTGIHVNIRSDDEDVFANQIVQEGARSPADVFYTENSPALEYLQERGLLAPVSPSTMAEIPARYESPQ